MFKKRTTKPSKETKLKFGDYGLLFNQQGLFEIKYIFILRRLLRKLRIKKNKKRRKVLIRSRMIWFVLFPNFIISKKSKNSRMGKGKGSLVRWSIRVRQGLVFLEFRGFSLEKIKAVKNNLQNSLQIKINTLFPTLWNYTTNPELKKQRVYTKCKFFL